MFVAAGAAAAGAPNPPKLGAGLGAADCVVGLLLEKLKLGFTIPVLGLPNMLLPAGSSFLVGVAKEKPPAGDAVPAWLTVLPPKLKLGLLALAGLPNTFDPAVSVVFFAATAANENPPEAGGADDAGACWAPPNAKGLVAATAGAGFCWAVPLPNMGVEVFGAVPNPKALFVGAVVAEDTDVATLPKAGGALLSVPPKLNTALGLAAELSPPPPPNANTDLLSLFPIAPAAGAAAPPNAKGVVVAAL